MLGWLARAIRALQRQGGAGDDAPPLQDGLGEAIMAYIERQRREAHETALRLWDGGRGAFWFDPDFGKPGWEPKETVSGKARPEQDMERPAGSYAEEVERLAGDYEAARQWRKQLYHGANIYIPQSFVRFVDHKPSSNRRFDTRKVPKR